MKREYANLCDCMEYPKENYHIPTAILSCEELQGLSFEAAIVYGLLFDKASREGEIDEQGRRIIRFSQPDLAALLRCKREHARTIWHELDSQGAGLIEQKRLMGQYMLLVRDFRSYMQRINEND